MFINVTYHNVVNIRVDFTIALSYTFCFPNILCYSIVIIVVIISCSFTFQHVLIISISSHVNTHECFFFQCTPGCLAVHVHILQK